MTNHVIVNYGKILGNIKQRCYNPNNRDYPKYGGKGVKVCQAWLDDTDTFGRDLPPAPEGWCALTLIDKTKDYAPGNVRWKGRGERFAEAREKRPTASREDVLDILKMIHEDRLPAHAVALGVPFTKRQIVKIALGKAHKIEGYTYPATMPELRTPEQIAKHEALIANIYAFADANGIPLTRLFYLVRSIMFKKRTKN